MKKKVRFLDSIAGMGDPRPTAELDAKYEAHRDKLRREALARGGREPSAYILDQIITDMKKQDRYGEKPIGFSRDWSFKPGDERVISSDLAEKWEDSGICIIVEDAPAGRKAA